VGAWLLWLVMAGSACRTVPPFAAANLAESGWTVRQGQAVWQRPQGAPEIAGEILVATRGDGESFVQFSKGAFPLLIAQSTPGRWQVEVPTQNQRYSGRGKPPARLLVLYLARALAGESLPAGWTWETKPDGGWRLANPKTGESLEGYFT
jgi:hypothetical protein